MATSPIYGWAEPDNTDLVKNGALAIRTMGDAIDTTMGTMTPKSTFTAKGSIAAATAASTPANLSVGANATMLIADSTAATGLAWKTAATQFPWTSYTPTLTAITLGNGTLTASYQQIGKTVDVRILFTLGSTSSVSSFPRFSVPVNIDVPSAQVQILGNANLNDAGTTAYYGVVAYETASTVQVFAQDTTGSTLQRATVTATVPFTWTTSDQMLLNFSYLGV